MRALLIPCIALLIGACTIHPSHDQPYSVGATATSEQAGDVLTHRVLLLGDAGRSKLHPLQENLQKVAQRAGLNPEKTTTLFLGDNIYPKGFPNKLDPKAFNAKQQRYVDRLVAQLQVASISGAEVFIIPGNHDWYAKQVDDQARFVRDYSFKNTALKNTVQTYFEPYDEGNPPYPEVVHRQGVSIVFLDTMWLLQADQAGFKSALIRLNQLLKTTREQYPNNLILVSAHHPIVTVGSHSKYYTTFKQSFYGSLIGMVYSLDQDLDHPRYQRLIAGLELTLGSYKKVVYVAGHEHNLQVFKSDDQYAPEYRLVSGAANAVKVSGVGHNEQTLFALAQEGFMELEIFSNGILLSVHTSKNKEPVHQRWLWHDKLRP